MTSLRAVLLLVFAFCGWVPSAVAATFLLIFSQPGDTSLNGLNGRFETTATITLTGDLVKRELYGISIQVANVTGLEFYPTPGTAFALGHYARVEAPGTPGHPGMRIGQCSTVIDGQFTIIDADVDAEGRLLTLAIDFEQHCRHSYASAYGGIRINSNIPYTAPPPPLPPPVRMTFAGEPGETITQATTRTLEDNASVFQIRGVPGKGRVTLTSSIDGAPWTFEFAGSAGAALLPGTYEMRLGAPADSPIFALGLGGATCSLANGRFVVHEAEHDDYRYTKLAVDFEHRCGGAPSTLYGQLRINSSVPYTVPNVGPPASLSIVQPAASFDVYEETAVTLQVAALDSGGARLPNVLLQLSVNSTVGCGSLPSVLRTDASGVATFVWTAPKFTSATISCPITIRSYPNGAAAVVFNARILQLPPATAQTLAYTAASPREYSVIASPGAAVRSITVRTVNASGFAVGGQRVRAVTTCGNFNTQFLVEVISDSSGAAVLPDWTPPQTPGDCLIEVSLPANPSAAHLSFMVHVTVPPPAIAPTASGQSPYGGTVTLSLPSSGTCSLTSAQFLDSQTMNMSNGTPMRLQMPHLVLDSYVIAAAKDCGSSVTITVEFPRPLPPTAQWWNYGSTVSELKEHWYQTPVTVSGNKVTFTIEDGGDGDGDRAKDGKVSLQGAMAIPGGTYQDLWWAGAIENGWGMSIVQHRDVLFANVFVYDAQGKPVWYVMPSGSWNAAKTTYTGSLYLPKGSPFYAYDVSRFDVGPAVGTASLAFSGANEATFDYTIGGLTGRKTMSRIAFGPRDSWSGQPFSDLWWGGIAQNGWGVALLQQYGTIFGLWYTYDASGAATWFVMPGGTWTRSNEWSGKTYRPEGSAWLGAPYDASRHRTVENGTFTFRFSSDEAASFDFTVDGKTKSVPLTRVPF